MAKPTIITRAGKGSALTWTEGDTNLTNLRDATITVTDGTNSKAIDLNGTIQFTAGTNMGISVNSSTGVVTISTTATTNTGTVTSVSGTGTVNGITLTGTVTSSGSLTLGGTLGSIANSQLTNSAITFGSTSQALGSTVSAINGVTIGQSTAAAGSFTTLSASTTTTSGAINATYNPSTSSGAAIQTSGGITQGGAGYFDFLKPTNTTSGATNANKSFRLNSTGTLEIINSGYTATILSLTDAGALTAPSITSSGSLTFKDPREAIYDNGNSGAATITPNAANGSVQKYTLTGNITWNAFGTPVAGQSITMILVQDGTGNRTLTSTGIKWAGGSKTLSTAASAIDIATVYYDGTNYYGSLAKGFV